MARWLSSSLPPQTHSSPIPGKPLQAKPLDGDIDVIDGTPEVANLGRKLDVVASTQINQEDGSKLQSWWAS